MASREIHAPRPAPELVLLWGVDLRVDSQIAALPMAAQRVLAFLALHEKPMLRAYVAGSLWHESEERHAGRGFRSALFNLDRPAYSFVELTSGRAELSREMSVDVRESIALCHHLLDQMLSFARDDTDDVRWSKDVLPDWTDDWLMDREHFRQLRLHTLRIASVS
jgi:hypothetical protein